MDFIKPFTFLNQKRLSNTLKGWTSLGLLRNILTCVNPLTPFSKGDGGDFEEKYLTALTLMSCEIRNRKSDDIHFIVGR